MNGFTSSYSRGILGETLFNSGWANGCDIHLRISPFPIGFAGNDPVGTPLGTLATALAHRNDSRTDEHWVTSMILDNLSLTLYKCRRYVLIALACLYLVIVDHSLWHGLILQWQQMAAVATDAVAVVAVTGLTHPQVLYSSWLDLPFCRNRRSNTQTRIW